MVICVMAIMDGAFKEPIRSFLTKEESIALLKEYQDEIEKENQGISERIKQLEASGFA